MACAEGQVVAGCRVREFSFILKAKDGLSAGTVLCMCWGEDALWLQEVNLSGV